MDGRKKSVIERGPLLFRGFLYESLAVFHNNCAYRMKITENLVTKGKMIIDSDRLLGDGALTTEGR